MSLLFDPKFSGSNLREVLRQHTDVCVGGYYQQGLSIINDIGFRCIDHKFA